MTDTVLIQWGHAHEIFAGKTMAEMALRRHPDLVAQMVEVPDGSVVYGDVWDGKTFSKPIPEPEPPRLRDPIAEIDAIKAEIAAMKVVKP